MRARRCCGKSANHPAPPRLARTGWNARGIARDRKRGHAVERCARALRRARPALRPHSRPPALDAGRRSESGTRAGARSRTDTRSRPGTARARGQPVQQKGQAALEIVIGRGRTSLNRPCAVSASDPAAGGEHRPAAGRKCARAGRRIRAGCRRTRNARAAGSGAARRHRSAHRPREPANTSRRSAAARADPTTRGGCA